MIEKAVKAGLASNLAPVAFMKNGQKMEFHADPKTGEILTPLATPLGAQDRTFGGYLCRQLCDLHAEGFKWARVTGVDDKHRCPTVFRNPFTCLAFVQNPSRDP